MRYGYHVEVEDVSIAGLRTAIKTGLATISSLQALDYAPESVNVPCAFVVPKTGHYDDMFGSSPRGLTHRFEVVLLVRLIPKMTQAQSDLDAYMEASGSSSIKAAVEAADLTTHGTVARVTGYRDYGGLNYNGVDYLGVKFDVEVTV